MLAAAAPALLGAAILLGADGAGNEAMALSSGCANGPSFLSFMVGAGMSNSGSITGETFEAGEKLTFRITGNPASVFIRVGSTVIVNSLSGNRTVMHTFNSNTSGVDILVSILASGGSSATVTTTCNGATSPSAMSPPPGTSVQDKTSSADLVTSSVLLAQSPLAVIDRLPQGPNSARREDGLDPDFDLDVGFCDHWHGPISSDVRADRDGGNRDFWSFGGATGVVCNAGGGFNLGMRADGSKFFTRDAFSAESHGHVLGAGPFVTYQPNGGPRFDAAFKYNVGNGIIEFTDGTKSDIDFHSYGFGFQVGQRFPFPVGNGVNGTNGQNGSFPQFWFEPNLSITHTRLKRNGFRDSGGTWIPGRTQELTQFQFSPRLGTNIPLFPEIYGTSEIYFGPTLIYNQTNYSSIDFADGTSVDDEALGYGFEVGLNANLRNGWKNSGNFRYWNAADNYGLAFFWTVLVPLDRLINGSWLDDLDSLGNDLRASDRRLKTDVTEIGQLTNGLKLYRYRYIWGGPARIGVMAQEVLGVMPEAVRDMGGWFAVNYAMLGLDPDRLAPAD